MALTASAQQGQTEPQNRFLSVFLTAMAALVAVPEYLLTSLRQWLVGLTNDTAQAYGRPEFQLANPDAHMGIMREIQLIGGSVIMIAIVVIVVNEVLTVDAVANSSGPFSDVIGSLETTGVAAMTLLVVGLLVVAAMALMRYFNNWG